MESPTGHVGTGLGLLLVGVWHLFNNIKHFSLNPNTFTSSSWYPFPKVRYLELYSIMSSISIILIRQLFISHKRHNPFNPDGTIPSSHLRNIEHSIVFISLIVYAVFAIVLDRVQARARKALTFLALATTFMQQLFQFHFHSTDHVGVEGQYHLLFQLVIFVSIVTTLMGIAKPNSFLVSFVRSTSFICQGGWLIIMGFMIFTPSLLSKGCFYYIGKYHQVIRCSSEEALHRAKSLINIEFSLLFLVLTIFIITFYLILDGVYREKVTYSSLNTKEQTEEDGEEQEDVESLKKIDYSSFVQMGKVNSHQDKI